ncbi:MAG TPA: GAF domain-containing SpoIIE family protein phosphatase, partial [Thermoanaerobaculia bacterium]
MTDDRVSRSLYALLELSKAMSSEVDLDSLLAVVVEKASTVVEAERTSVFVYDAASDRLSSRIAQGIGGEVIELPPGEGIAGDVARTRQLANIPNAYVDPRFSPDADRRTGFLTRSVLCAPIFTPRGRLLGVIQSVNKRNGGAFDAHDEKIMEALASQVAVAIERAQMTEVYVENERFEQALQVAQDIQMRMLPRGDAAAPAPEIEVSATLRPARMVGGDLYDFFLRDARSFCFCIGDVAGKGVGSALVMAVAKTLFRANGAVLDDPAALMAAMNARLYEETDTTMFVTAFCGILDLESGAMRFSNAGHNPPLILSPGGGRRLLSQRPGIALGVLPKFVYATHETALAPGETLYLYTDGVSEATNAAGDLFTLERIEAVVRGSGASSPATLVASTLAAVDAFAAGTPQADDIT